jgi:hypothetical protein
MKGRRLPNRNADEDGKLWGGPFKLTLPENPGDYCGPVMGYTGDKPAVFFLKPNARDPDVPKRARAVQHVISPPHVFTEEPDGSLTITGSIGDKAKDSESDGWHGHLVKGEWIKC